MLYTKHSNDTRACQQAIVAMSPTSAPAIVAYARTGPVDVGRVVAAVARAYNDTHPAAAVVVEPTAILGQGRQPDVAWARHLCAYLLVEDGKLTNQAAARALGRTDHTTVLNSRARIAAALASGRDPALTATVVSARASLTGEDSTPASRRRERGNRSIFAVATPAELAEYRYWRLRSLHRGDVR